MSPLRFPFAFPILADESSYQECPLCVSYLRSIEEARELLNAVTALRDETVARLEQFSNTDCWLSGRRQGDIRHSAFDGRPHLFGGRPNDVDGRRDRFDGRANDSDGRLNRLDERRNRWH